MSSLGIFNKETKTYQKVAGDVGAAILDKEMSDTSENPVQNKVIKKYVDSKQVEVPIAGKKKAGIVKPADGLIVAEDGTLKVSLDGTTLTMDQVNNVIKLADTLKEKINGALPAANVVNNITTTEAGFALDARQANPNIDGTLAKQLSDLNGSLFKGECIFLASLTNRGVWTPFEVQNLSQFKQIQILFRDFNVSELASNLASYASFKDCNSVVRVFQARYGAVNNNDLAQAHYVDDTHVEIYLATGDNSNQAVLVGWR